MLRMAAFAADEIPVFCGPAVKAGQHHMAVRQVGDAGDQLSCGGKGACRSGDDDHLFGLPLTPDITAQPDKPVATVGSVNHPLFLKDRRPPVYEDGKKLQNVLPVAREPVRQQIAQHLGRGVGIAQRIKKPGQRFSKAHRLRRGWRDITETKPFKKAGQP